MAGLRSLRAKTVARSHSITSRLGYLATLSMYLERATSSRGSRATSRSTPALSPPLLNSATQYLPCSTASLSQRSASKRSTSTLNDRRALPLTQVKCVGRGNVAAGQRVGRVGSAIPHCRSCSCSRPGTKKSESNKRPGLQGSFEAAGRARVGIRQLGAFRAAG